MKNNISIDVENDIENGVYDDQHGVCDLEDYNQYIAHLTTANNFKIIGTLTILVTALDVEMLLWELKNKIFELKKTDNILSNVTQIYLDTYSHIIRYPDEPTIISYAINAPAGDGSHVYSFVDFETVGSYEFDFVRKSNHKEPFICFETFNKKFA